MASKQLFLEHTKFILQLYRMLQFDTRHAVQYCGLISEAERIIAQMLWCSCVVASSQRHRVHVWSATISEVKSMCGHGKGDQSDCM